MIRVLTGGLQTTVQDRGRVGHQRDGVPAGGAMDRTALRVGNLLVGNSDDSAAIEASLIGPSLAFEERTLIALTGADLGVAIDEFPIPLWRPVVVPAGSTLRFGRSRVGCRAYIAVAGGIDAVPVLGSRSTYLRAAFGGYKGRALRAGDELPTGTASASATRLMSILSSSAGAPAPAPFSADWSIRPHYSDAPTVRAIPGAHTEHLTTESRTVLTSSLWRVSSSSDRMGYRLAGVPLHLRAPMELLSEGVAFGTIQLPPSGAPIVLMADRQTTGGYPRIGEVASLDLPLVAQLRPGDSLHLRFITLDEAQNLALQHERDLALARIAVSLTSSRGMT